MERKSRTFSRMKIATSAAALAVVGLGAFGGTMAVSAEQQANAAAEPAVTAELKPKSTTSTNHLTIEAANRAAQAAMDAAQQDNRRVTVAVVDRNGNTILTMRGDGAGPQSYESAIKKAWTAAAWNAPTSKLVERLDDAPTLADIPNTLFLAGGVPIAFDNGPIAGIGVAGAPAGTLDERFAQAGLTAISNGS